MGAALLQSKRSCQTVGQVHNYETCPICLEKARRDDCAVCIRCSKKFEEMVAQAERRGEVVVVTKKSWACRAAKDSVEKLDKERQLAAEEEIKFFQIAREMVCKDLADKDIISIDTKSFGKKVRTKFDELNGPGKRGDLLFIKRVYPLQIASLKKLIASMEEKTQSAQNHNTGSEENAQKTAQTKAVRAA